MLFKILHRFTGAVLFEREADSLRLCIEAAVEMRARLDGARLVGASLDGASLVGARLVGARLDGASLVGASLDGASLVGARLVGARLDGASLVGARLDGARLDGASLDGASGIIDLGQRTDGYRFLLVRHETGPMVKAGCHWEPAATAIAHWSSPAYPDARLGRESVARIEMGLSTARELGWPMGEPVAKAA